MTDAELKRLLDTAVAEMRRHFDIASERSDQRLDQIVEAIANVDQKLDRHVERLDERVDRGFAETQAMIKFSHAELDRRVSKLEQAFSDLHARVERLETATH